MKTLCLIFLLCLAFIASSVQAETINCTPITSLPATITTQGIYCLTGNLATSETSGNAITIEANNVSIDLNGWKLGGQGAGTGTTAIGISSSAINVTVKNGIVRGFYVGIELTGSGAVVEDILADSNMHRGIYVGGLGALVEHNQVVNTGGSTTATDLFAEGISVFGSDSTVSDNVVSGVTATGNGGENGIYLNGPDDTARNNVVSNTALPGGAGTAYGIVGSDSIISNNTVSLFQFGVSATGGIYSYNTANDCTTDFAGSGTAGVGNSGT